MVFANNWNPIKSKPVQDGGDSQLARVCNAEKAISKAEIARYGKPVLNGVYCITKKGKIKEAIFSRELGNKTKKEQEDIALVPYQLGKYLEVNQESSTGYYALVCNSKHRVLMVLTAKYLVELFYNEKEHFIRELEFNESNMRVMI